MCCVSLPNRETDTSETSWTTSESSSWTCTIATFTPATAMPKVSESTCIVWSGWHHHRRSGFWVAWGWSFSLAVPRCLSSPSPLTLHGTVSLQHHGWGFSATECVATLSQSDSRQMFGIKPVSACQSSLENCLTTYLPLQLIEFETLQICLLHKVILNKCPVCILACIR